MREMLAMKLTQSSSGHGLAAPATRQPVSDSHLSTAKRRWPVAVVIIGLLGSIAWGGFLAWGVIWLVFFHHS
jgi:hypothetical protein